MLWPAPANDPPFIRPFPMPRWGSLGGGWPPKYEREMVGLKNKGRSKTAQWHCSSFPHFECVRVKSQFSRKFPNFSTLPPPSKLPVTLRRWAVSNKAKCFRMATSSVMERATAYTYRQLAFARNCCDIRTWKFQFSDSILPTLGREKFQFISIGVTDANTGALLTSRIVDACLLPARIPTRPARRRRR